MRPRLAPEQTSGVIDPRGDHAAGGPVTEVVVSPMLRVSDDEAALSVGATCGGSKVDATYRFYRVLGVWRAVE